VMEYCDFLDVWAQIHRTILFDSTWIMSSQWLQIPVRPLPSAWTYGDVVFTFTLPKRSLAIVVLSQIDSRYFKEISGTSCWTLDFTLVKRGEATPIAESASTLLYARSVNLEMELDEGEYNVYVRIDRTTFKDPDYFRKGVENGWDHRKLSRILTERAKSRSIASNFRPGIQERYLPEELPILIERDRVLYEKKKAVELAKKQEEEEGTKTVTVTVTTTTTTTTTVHGKNVKSGATGSAAPVSVTATSTTSEPSVVTQPSAPVDPPSLIHTPKPTVTPPPNVPAAPLLDACIVDPGLNSFGSFPPPARSYSPVPPPPRPPAAENPSPPFEIAEDENSVYLGLRVYSKDAAAIVGGLLYSDIVDMGMLSPQETRPPSPFPTRMR